jgi:hypothetical protein
MAEMVHLEEVDSEARNSMYLHDAIPRSSKARKI